MANQSKGSLQNPPHRSSPCFFGAPCHAVSNDGFASLKVPITAFEFAIASPTPTPRLWLTYSCWQQHRPCKEFHRCFLQVPESSRHHLPTHTHHSPNCSVAARSSFLLRSTTSASAREVGDASLAKGMGSAGQLPKGVSLAGAVCTWVAAKLGKV